MSTASKLVLPRRGFLASSLAGGVGLLSGPARAEPSACGAAFDQAAYERYVGLMNAKDLGFVDYYANDIQFEMNIQGKAAVVNFYQQQWQFVEETLQIAFFCSDAGGAAAEVSSMLRCIRDFDDTQTFGRALKAGEVQVVRGYVLYNLNAEGLIAQIHGPPPEVIEPWHMPAA